MYLVLGIPSRAKLKVQELRNDLLPWGNAREWQAECEQTEAMAWLQRYSSKSSYSKSHLDVGKNENNHLYLQLFSWTLGAQLHSLRVSLQKWMVAVGHSE